MKLSVVVHPNSKNPRIEKDLMGVTHVYVREPALGGRANEAVIKALSKHFNVTKSSIKLIYGFKSKTKVVEI